MEIALFSLVCFGAGLSTQKLACGQGGHALEDVLLLFAPGTYDCSALSQGGRFPLSLFRNWTRWLSFQ